MSTAIKPRVLRRPNSYLALLALTFYGLSSCDSGQCERNEFNQIEYCPEDVPVQVDYDAVTQMFLFALAVLVGWLIYRGLRRAYLIRKLNLTQVISEEEQARWTTTLKFGSFWNTQKFWFVATCVKHHEGYHEVPLHFQGRNRVILGSGSTSKFSRYEFELECRFCREGIPSQFRPEDFK